MQTAVLFGSKTLCVLTDEGGREGFEPVRTKGKSINFSRLCADVFFFWSRIYTSPIVRPILANSDLLRVRVECINKD